MARDRTARARIREHLISSGPVIAASGYATTHLKDAVAYEGSPVAFIQLVAAMERDGEIERDVRGKRTYRIAAGPNAESAPRPAAHGAQAARVAPAPVDVDYQQLARAIVVQMLAGADKASSSDADLTAERDDYIRRLRDARSRIDELLGQSVEDARSCETR